ncbi:MAG: EAL domain-containing protein [Synergistaceae bacterium]|nr:EAL domain-containing protein [Synergistaceae bacterium]
MRDSLDKTSYGSFYFNLTKNVCTDGHSRHHDVSKLMEPGTVDGFFEYAYSRHTDKENLKEFKKTFSRSALIKAFEHGDTTLQSEHRYMIEQGNTIWLRVSFVMAKNPETDDIEAYLYVDNIDAERTIAAFMNKYLEVEYEFAMIIDSKTGLLSFVKLLGSEIPMTPHNNDNYMDAVRRDYPKFIAKRDLEHALKAMDLTHVTEELKRHDTYSCSFSMMDDDGKIRRKTWKYTYIDNERTKIACMRRDVTREYNLETDPLTGIYNRYGFCLPTRRMLDEHSDIDFFVAVTDMDHFKVYNDVYGSEAGDALLEKFSECISERYVENMVFGRLEGDYFAACLPVELMDVEKSIKYATEKLSELQKDFTFTLRQGIYVVDDKSLNVNIMCDRALMALRSTKGKYDISYAFYDSSMRAVILEKQEIVSSMNSALAKGEFNICLQPQYDQTTGKIVGAEALARWFRGKEVISPTKFIPVFEENGFIMQFDKYIWELACKLLRKWKDEGRPLVPISVNVSRLDIYNRNLRDILNGLVKQYGLTRDLLRLEITETAYMQDPEQLVDVVRQLREDGFYIEMDDFGSGYSSLNMLKNVVVDLIKLDMQFLSSSDDSAENGRSGLILNAMVRMIRWLNIPVMAEGVETRLQADFLKNIGCGLVQGYLYAKPLSTGDFEALISEESIGHITKSPLTTSFFNANEFWDVESHATVIFNTFVGAACIVEYKDEHAEILRANDKFYQLTGAGRDEFTGRNSELLQVVSENDRAVLIDTVDAAIATNDETVCELRWKALRNPGRLLWLRTHMRVIAKGVDRYIFYVSVENTTERKKMEETLLASEEELRLAMEQTGRTILHYDVPTMTLTITEAYAEKHASTETTLRDIPYSSKMPTSSDRQNYYQFFEKILRGEKSGSATVQLQNSDGTYAWEEMEFTNIFGEDEKPLRAIITVNDVTAEMEKRAEDERNRVIAENTGSLIFDYDYGSDVLTTKVKLEGKGFTTIRREHYLESLNIEKTTVHPDSLKAYRAAYAEAAKAPTRGVLDYYVDNWGTGYRHCIGYYVSLANESGRVYRLVGVVNEMADEKDSEN